MSELEVDLRDGMAIARIRGEIDLSNADALFSALTQRAGDGVHALLVDLSGVDYMDSAGVRLLFRLARAAGETEQALRTVVPRDAPIRGVLELAQAQSHLGIDDSEAVALETLRREAV